MNIMSAIQHLIVGGGISGCLMAKHLTDRQLDFKLLEAQNTLGGRIKSTDQGTDLGPTWFWPHQHQVQTLLDELNLSAFNQYTQGDLMYQANPNGPAQREIYQQDMQSLRVSGGMMAIIQALKAKVPEQHISVNTAVSKISKLQNEWQVTSLNGDTLLCEHLWLAMPPRKVASLFLAEENPALSEALLSHLQNQQTWMSAQAKFVAEYDASFWREAGLSGQAFSRVGPMVEVHDACGANTDSPAALFGFIGVPVNNRRSIDPQQMINACVAQLGKLFGKQALSPNKAYFEDWATNPYVASDADIGEPSQHAHFNSSQFSAELKDLKLGLIGSEFSQTDPGYIAGAIDHVNQSIASL